MIRPITLWPFPKKPLLAALCPVVANGVIVGVMLAVFYALPLWLTMLEVAVGEAVAVALGFILLAALRKVDLSRFQ